MAKIAGMLLERGQLTIREILAFGKEETGQNKFFQWQSACIGRRQTGFELKGLGSLRGFCETAGEL